MSISVWVVSVGKYMILVFSTFLFHLAAFLPSFFLLRSSIYLTFQDFFNIRIPENSPWSSSHPQFLITISFLYHIRKILPRRLAALYRLSLEPAARYDPLSVKRCLMSFNIKPMSTFCPIDMYRLLSLQSL